jgi:hypothetical protein
MTALILTAGSLIAVLMLAAAQYAAYRQIRQLKRGLQVAADRQEALLHSCTGLMIQLGQAQAGLEQRMVSNERRQQELESKDTGSLTYAQASKLVQMGADTQDLVKSCGLSEAEAKLVSLLAARGVGRPV